MTGFKPFAKFTSGVEYAPQEPVSVEMSVSFDRDSDYFRFAEISLLRHIKITFPEGKRLSPLIHKGTGVEITIMGGEYVVTGKLLWRRLNVAMIEGYMTKHVLPKVEQNRTM